jgi:hypothetical protein
MKDLCILFITLLDCSSALALINYIADREGGTRKERGSPVYTKLAGVAVIVVETKQTPGLRLSSEDRVAGRKQLLQ